MKTPSPAQMRALQLLREGKLVWRGPESVSLDKERPEVKYPLPVDERIYPVTARILVDRDWVEMRGFNPRQGVYRLSAAGKALTGLLCECKYTGRWGRGTQNKPAHDFTLLSGIDPVTTAKIDWPKERLLCAKCWRLARCEAKFFKQAHAANRYIWGVGPVCQFHVDNPTKR